MKRLPMGWLVLGTFAGVWVLAFFNVVSVVVAVAVTLADALVGAVFLDLTTRGSGNAVRDRNAANFFAPVNNQTWTVPTSYIDHPTGGGPPPGEDYDREDIEAMAGDRPAGANREDLAP